MLDALAHEFKTPLTSIKAAVTSVLQDRVIAPAHAELLRVVDEETDRLSTMVTEAIQMARIEAGHIELRKGVHSIAGLIRQSLARMAAALESRPVEVRPGEDLPPVSADPILVRIVVRQLVDNAIRYSPPGSGIVIRAVREGDWIVVGVADQGPGIPEPERARIFEKFYRGGGADETAPGTGMGLAIVRQIIQAHGGEVRVESRPGQGSQFFFSLPMAREQPPA
jgi:two-component system sensor histidine kinase KdpD